VLLTGESLVDRPESVKCLFCYPDNRCLPVGLDPELAETGTVAGALGGSDTAARRQRDRRPGELVLTTYEFQCACCGVRQVFHGAPRESSGQPVLAG